MTVSAEKPQIVSYLSKSVTYTAFDIRWIPCSAKVVVVGQHARGTGALQVLELNDQELSIVSESEKAGGFKCSTFGGSSLAQRYLATGDFDGRMSVWDLERIDLPVYSCKKHNEIINAIDGIGGTSVNCGAPEILTGGRDGHVNVWDIRQAGRPVASITPSQQDDARDCWCVSFGNSYNNQERMVCAGYDNGDVKMFDLRSMKLHWETNIKNGVCGIEFDRKDIKMNKLVAVGLESALDVFDLRTFHSKQKYAHLSYSKPPAKPTIWTVRHLPQNRDIFMVGNGTGHVQLFKYNYPSERAKPDENKEMFGIPGSLTMLNDALLAQQPVAALDWNPDKIGLCAMASYDQTVRIVVVTKLNQY